MTMTKSNLAADDQRPDTPPTHIMYTPIWEPDGGKFRKWLAVGIVPFTPEYRYLDEFRLPKR